MSDLPNIKVKDLGNRIANVEPRAAEKTKHSGWFITISTNYRPKSTEDGTECADVLRAGIKHMLTNDGLKEIVEFVTLTPTGATRANGRPINERSINPDHYWSGTYIKDVDSEFVIERGRHRQGGRIHAHIILKIEHVSYIQLSKQKIKDLLLTYYADHPTLGCIKSLYIHINLIGRGGLLANYLRKEALDDKEEGKADGAPGLSG